MCQNPYCTPVNTQHNANKTHLGGVISISQTWVCLRNLEKLFFFKKKKNPYNYKGPEKKGPTK